MNKLNILYMLISTIFTFVSCTRVKNKDLKVNILALTESESIYFIQKADTIEYKCYKIMNVLSKDKNGQSIVVPYGSQTKELYDSYTLNWRRKGQDPL